MDVGLCVTIVFSIIGFFLVYNFQNIFLIKSEKSTENISSMDDDIIANWYKILGVLEGDDIETIKRAYRQKMANVHPDKFSFLGDNFVKLAAREACLLNQAYDRVKVVKKFV